MQISPGMTLPPSRLCLSDLRHGVPCKFRALTKLAALPHRDASYPLPVRQASVLPSASFRFAVTQNTLAVQLTLPIAASTGLSPPSKCALPGAPEKTAGGKFRLPLLFASTQIKRGDQ